MSLDSILVTIELMCSHFSGKKKVFRDGKLVFETQKFGNAFQYPFQIGAHMLNIVQHGEHFELRIDNQSFSHLYHMDRTKRAFVFEGEETEPGAHNENQKREVGVTTSNSKGDEVKDEEPQYGYGNYKKSHIEPKRDWQDQNKAIQHNQKERELEIQEIDDMWRPQGKESTGPKFEVSDIRKKRYDDTFDSNPPVGDLLEVENMRPAAKKTQVPQAFDFDTFGITNDAAAIVKKAQYITGPKANQ